jgi:hypothetical protein
MHPKISVASLPPFVGTTDLVHLFGVTHRTIYDWVATGRLPEPVRLGRNLRWPRDCLTPLLASLGATPAEQPEDPLAELLRRLAARDDCPPHVQEWLQRLAAADGAGAGADGGKTPSSPTAA